MIRILLSIKYNIYRTCLKKILEESDEICVAGEVSGLDEADKNILRNNYDIIITDMNIKEVLLQDVLDGDPLNSVALSNTTLTNATLTNITLNSAKSNNTTSNKLNSTIFNSTAGIIFLTSSDNVDDIRKFISLEYDGIVSLYSEMSKLMEAIYSVYNKERYIDDKLKVISNENKSEKSSLLTRREIEVLKLIAQGCFNKEIAAKMGITERTVKNHVSNIFKKIDVCDRTQAALYAIRNNIVIL